MASSLVPAYAYQVLVATWIIAIATAVLAIVATLGLIKDWPPWKAKPEVTKSDRGTWGVAAPGSAPSWAIDEELAPYRFRFVPWAVLGALAGAITLTVLGFLSSDHMLYAVTLPAVGLSCVVLGFYFGQRWSD